MQETCVQSLGLEDPLQEEMATHSSILAWRIPWTEKPGGLQPTGMQSATTQWLEMLCTSLIVQNQSLKKASSILVKTVFLQKVNLDG